MSFSLLARSAGSHRGSGVSRRDCILSAASLLVTGTTPAAATGERRLMVVGDSLSAEYGLRRGSGWVALVTARLRSRDPSFDVVNASISGDTTAGGKARLGELLNRHNPSHVVIELGANDALRGLPLKDTRENLVAMCQQCRAAKSEVLLIGIQVPPNYGSAYTTAFAGLFPDIARQESTALVPFMLKGIADVEQSMRWFQADRIHPNESAQPVIVDTIWPTLNAWLALSAKTTPKPKG